MEHKLTPRQVSAIASACRLIDTADTMPTLDELAAAAAMSRFHFHRLFRAVTGVTPREYADGRRAERVREELMSRQTVTEALHDAGFGSNGRFYSASSRILGMTPTQYRRHGRGVRIRFAVGQCSLGAILVAATDRGVCAVSVGDDPDALVRDLQDDFSEALLVPGDGDFEDWVAKVVGCVEHPGRGLDLPLEIRGTAFQQRVWRALTEIPAGTTVTYTDVAERIGAPGAARAVARACAVNPIAVAIPCHRVVRRDGGLAGYRWGVERKRRLLEREQGSLGSDPALVAEQDQ